MSAIVPFRTDGFRVVVDPRLAELRDAALERSALIGAVTDDASNAAATAVMQDLKGLLSTIEKTRKAAKEPVLDLGRQIDEVARRESEDIKAELERVNRAAADYQTAQMERVRAQERARAEEAARIERERQEAMQRIEQERLAAEAEARQKAEKELAAAKSTEEKVAADKRAREQQERIRAEAEAKAQAEADRRKQEELMLPPVTSSRAPGQSVKAVWRWEVTDVWALVRTNPGLVEVTPRKAEINAAIDAIAGTTDKPQIPGLRIWSEVAVSVRASKSCRTIDVEAIP